MWFEQVMFFVAGILALGGALGVVMLRNPFYSVLALVAHLVALALLFLLLRAQFVAAAQVVVYAGAVMALSVFVVAYIGGSDEPLRPEGGLIGSFGPLGAARLGVELCIALPGAGVDPRGARRAAAALGVELCIATLGTGLDAVDSRAPDVGAGFGSPAQIGALLLQRFLIPFEAAAYLLLVAAVGAVVLARRRRGLEA